jgi:hypothetical protein
MDLALLTGWSRFAPKTSSGTRDRTPKYRGRPNRISEGRRHLKGELAADPGQVNRVKRLPEKSLLGTVQARCGRGAGRDAALSIPTPGHYLPLLYVLATGQKREIVRFRCNSRAKKLWRPSLIAVAGTHSSNTEDHMRAVGYFAPGPIAARMVWAIGPKAIVASPVSDYCLQARPEIDFFFFLGPDLSYCLCTSGEE